ncbi:hypothetical protein PENARI_c018G06926 [Penicillium arizonense]|uniref:Fungal lipase-type domain-containing protein n=1 Tax=Penicillium arizonense TaxID=1835702 RepID=A0A1F5LA90_PENAI|nr:hypothetical protein PENARI_c018G06926 [Penicillium arizonense]OGE50112.1 hypothetical protein PENARI_c018G06926 [Penicillium arizonense]
MAFGHSTRSRRRSTSPEPPPKPPRPRQRAESTPAPPTQYGYRYATTSTYSVNTCHASPPVAPYHQIGTMSMVRLPPQPAIPPSQSFPGMLVASPQPVWNPQQPLPTQRPSKWKSYTSLNQSMSHLVSHTVEKTNATIQELEQLVHQSLGGGANVNEATSRLLDQVITSIDLGSFCGRESELIAACAVPSQSDRRDRRSQRTGKKHTGSVDYFSKVYLYANSRLPPHIQTLKFYPATYPLLQLAAKYSRRAYDKPSGRERHSYVNSDWLQGTKAMVVKSLPIDDMNTIVFAIRGTQSFIDWAVNVHTAPTSPSGFLDDPSNCCHSGFLSVSRKMAATVAERLRNLLEEDPSRMSYSLVLTGHSAGGAVASLLYLHMLSESPAVQSELTHLRGCFRHIHCVTFGAPPISLRPLQPSPAALRSKSLFFAFINEGDPVARADKGYFLSLLDLYVSPAPGSMLTLYDRKKQHAPILWRTPASTLALAGRLIVLRPREQWSGRPVIVAPPVPGGPPTLPPREKVDACGVTDTELRGVVFGDPVMHFMDLYSRRIDAIARGALGKR